MRQERFTRVQPRSIHRQSESRSYALQVSLARRTRPVVRCHDETEGRSQYLSAGDRTNLGRDPRLGATEWRIRIWGEALQNTADIAREPCACA
jgi:hypothetical protein